MGVCLIVVLQKIKLKESARETVLYCAKGRGGGCMLFLPTSVDSAISFHLSRCQSREVTDLRNE